MSMSVKVNVWKATLATLLDDREEIKSGMARGVRILPRPAVDAFDELFARELPSPANDVLQAYPGPLTGRSPSRYGCIDSSPLTESSQFAESFAPCECVKPCMFFKSFLSLDICG